MDMFFQDVRYGFRILRKNPGFTFVAIFALALGIGANTALFSVVYGVLLRPLPYAEGKQLVVLQQSFARAKQPNVRFSVKEIKDYREQARSLQEVEEYHQMGFILLNDKEPDNVDTGVVSAHFFDMLGVKPLLGRNFVDDDDRPGAEPVLLLSYKYWKTKHGGDPNVVGRYFRMNDKAHRVIGVLPPIPQYPNENDVYMPTVACPFRSSPMMTEGRDHRMMRVLGRLKPGMTLDASKADMAMLANRWQQAYPEVYPATAGFTATVDTLHNQLTQQVRPMLLVLLATAGLVLLIACANVANLALARMVRREQELAVRTALGANRLALFRQLLTESTLLSLAGGALGLIFASACVNLLIAFVGRFTTRAAEVQIDFAVLFFTLIVSLLTGLVFGSIPALSSRLNLSMALKEGSKASTEKSTRHRVRSLLVIGQVAVSFILLIGAGLMIRSFVKLQRVDAGYNANDVLTVNVPLNFSKYKNDKEVTVFFDRLTAKLEGQAGIKAVAVTSGPPLSPGRPSNTPFDIEGRALAAGEPRPIADVNVASPDSFRLMGVPLISGRFFTLDDKHDSLPVVIVNRSFARHFFPNEDPINKRLSGDSGKTWVTIVGIVGDVKQYGLEKDAIDMVYTPFAQSPMGGGSLLLRAGGDPLSYVKQVRDAVYSIDSEQPITDIKTLDQLRGDSLAATRVTAMLLGLFSVLALAIAATGLSGVIAFLVSQRTREIGIRMALGAQTADIQKMVLSDAMQMIGIGLLVGLAGALFTTRVMQKLLFKTGTTDLMTFVSVAIGLALVALVASYLPARSATRVDPLVALRAE
jgi:putative ABC transport system permease protein